MDRDRLLGAVADRLGSRRLIWSGLRGEDVEPLTDLPQLHASYSIIGRYRRRERVESLAYEDLTGLRPDLELFDIDDHLAEETALSFRRAHLHALSEPSALVPYRSSQFLSSIWFARRDRCIHLGLFGGHEAAFEHKPWVETSLQGLGVVTVPWIYVADEEQLVTRMLLADGPMVLRRSRTSGGEGFVLLDDPSALAEAWPHVAEAFVSVSPFLEGTTPINVGAVVWHDGVTVHHASVQLVGLDACVTRPFGYCGNDFALAADLDPGMLDQIEATTRRIGDWLRRHGYLGTFGVDYLVHEGKVLFTEINPRFQGSTHLSCRLSVEAGESCLMLEHVAAFLGIDAPTPRSLREQAHQAGPLAQVVVHWTGDRPAKLDPTALVTAVQASPHGLAAEVRTRPQLLTERGAVVARLLVRGGLTTDGFDLRDPWHDAIRNWVASAAAAPPRSSEGPR